MASLAPGVSLNSFLLTVRMTIAFQIMTLLVTLGRWTICSWFLSIGITGMTTSSWRLDLTLDITLRFQER
eukprot:4623143-Heterocapsa_arctica.AAC.1